MVFSEIRDTLVNIIKMAVIMADNEFGLHNGNDKLFAFSFSITNLCGKGAFRKNVFIVFDPRARRPFRGALAVSNQALLESEINFHYFKQDEPSKLIGQLVELIANSLQSGGFCGIEELSADETLSIDVDVSNSRYINGSIRGPSLDADPYKALTLQVSGTNRYHIFGKYEGMVI